MLTMRKEHGLSATDRRYTHLLNHTYSRRLDIDVDIDVDIHFIHVAVHCIFLVHFIHVSEFC